MSIIERTLVTELQKLRHSYAVCGIVDRAGSVYPLGSDTKVLSTIFELVSRPAVHSAANSLDYFVVEPRVQNHYPDFTLMRGEDDIEKMRFDVETTYRRSGCNPVPKIAFSVSGDHYAAAEGIMESSISIPAPFMRIASFTATSFTCSLNSR
ncbi:MAG: hypothetical protein OXI79_17555 [Gammaproteobacteria bacterium]|nr:hypothetical protein [Gammaproteobacteria bacterium]